MPSIEPPAGPQSEPEPLTRLPFEPVTRQHILHCSYDYWHSKYRSSCIKSRIISLSPAFLSYLREDGIILPPEAPTPSHGHNQTFPSDDSGWDDEPDADPSLQFREIHKQIQVAISELGGLVAPKLNWSAPKDATWIAMKKNSMECATPNDIYLLLKSSDFVTHDTEHAFDGTEPDETVKEEDINYVLVLRKWFKVNPSCEFRCFVRDGRVVGICPRDLNHFDFLFPLAPRIREAILEFFDRVLKNNFPENSFVFDIYLPDPYEKPRLMDINPFAPRTDPLLFSWLELLQLEIPMPLLGIPDSASVPSLPQLSSDEDTQDEEAEEEMWRPELRLVKKDDPEAYAFGSTQYSAHKLPREVVEAGVSGEGGMREFADRWKDLVDGRLEESDSEDEDEGG